MSGRVWRGGLPLAVLRTLGLRREARRTAHGMMVLRRAYEHVLVTAVLEGSGPTQGPYYDSYVDALQILGARAALIARAYDHG